MELKKIPDGAQVVYNHLGERVVLDLAQLLHSFATTLDCEATMGKTPITKKKAAK